MRIAVIGGGINGLASAWQLALAGHQVELFERDALMPLPQRRFEAVIYTVGTLAPDCHVKSGKAFYSAPGPTNPTDQRGLQRRKNSTGTSSSTGSGSEAGGAGSGCARWKVCNASSSRDAWPLLRCNTTDNTRPCRSMRTCT